jgi:hypothetical protein
MVRVIPLDGCTNTAPQRRGLGLPEWYCQVPDHFDELAFAEIADLFEGV